LDSWDKKIINKLNKLNLKLDLVKILKNDNFKIRFSQNIYKIIILKLNLVKILKN